MENQDIFRYRSFDTCLTFLGTRCRVILAIIIKATATTFPISTFPANCIDTDRRDAPISTYLLMKRSQSDIN